MWIFIQRRKEKKERRESGSMEERLNAFAKKEKNRPRSVRAIRAGCPESKVFIVLAIGTCKSSARTIFAIIQPVNKIYSKDKETHGVL